MKTMEKLNCRRKYKNAKQNAETPEQRELCLAKCTEKKTELDMHAARTTEQRETMLLQIGSRHQERQEAESFEKERQRSRLQNRMDFGSSE